ncbi:MAG TPA: amidase family protein, partial [Kofleriaceae bacterium]
MAALHELSAHQLVSAYAKGELSPVEVARAALARMELWEPKINAMYRVARDTALVEAQGAEARWRKAAPLSALDGVPITIKENIYTRG